MRPSLLIAIILFSLTIQKANASCLYQPPKIDITTQFDGPTLDRSKSAASLGASLGNSSPEYITQGLTRTQSFVKRNISVAFERMPNGQVCGNVEQISILIALQGPAQVFVASEIEPGSCRDRVTIEHEQLHINHAFDAQQMTKQAIEAALPSALERMLPVLAATQDEAVAMIGSQIDRALEQIGSPVEAERTARDQAIDSPESYARLTALCP